MTSIGRLHSSAAGAVLVAGLLAAATLPAKEPAVRRAKPGEWIACKEVYKEEAKAREVAADCIPSLSCDEFGERRLVQPKLWRTPQLPRGYDGPSGWVRLKVFFDEDGKFVAADVLSSPDPRLTEEAMATARGMEVHPACLEGRRIPQMGQLPFFFGIV